MTDKKKHKPIFSDDPIINQTVPNKHDPVLQQEAKSTAVTVDAESTITPITKQEIKPVDAEDWGRMTVHELYDQMQILQQRKYYCQRHAPLLINDIERGIKRLELIIKRHGDEVKLL